jgi:D-alanyl-lipoteichoic acid acyltransferase DltB (MBOAT superfamily)
MIAGVEGRWRRFWLIASLLANLGSLVVFKWHDFFLPNAERILNAVGLDAHLSALGLILPLGISFYTFRDGFLIRDIGGRYLWLGQPDC